MIRNSWVKLNLRLVTFLGGALYLAFSGIYLFLGQVNADEGWYLYASKLVFQGNIPYRDFAYTQTPLLLYIYGLPQIIFSPSIYLGRAISVLFSIIGFLLCILLAHRYAGKLGAGLTALLLGTFTYGIYFTSIVKTYAFLFLLFALTFLVLSSRIPDTWKYLLAVSLSFFAAMVRLSAILFMLPIVIYSLISTFRQPTKFFLLISLCCVFMAIVLIFLCSDPEAVKWNLITHHVTQWGDASTGNKIVQIVNNRIPDFILYFDGYILMTCLLLSLAVFNAEIKTKIKPFLQNNLPLIVAGIGLTLFSISHLSTGGWHLEYFVPALMLFLTLIAILFSKIYTLQKNFSSKTLLTGILIATLLLPLIRHNVQHIDISGGAMPIEEIREVSKYISKNSNSSDRVFVLEALWIAIESNRSVLPGMTMAKFSYQDVNRLEAEKLKLVNGEIATEYINDCRGKIVVLTDGDWQMFIRTGYGELIRQALFDHYELILTRNEFGQKSNNVYVYQCRAGQK